MELGRLLCIIIISTVAIYGFDCKQLQLHLTNRIGKLLHDDHFIDIYSQVCCYSVSSPVGICMLRLVSSFWLVVYGVLPSGSVFRSVVVVLSTFCLSLSRAFHQSSTIIILCISFNTSSVHIKPLKLMSNFELGKKKEGKDFIYSRADIFMYIQRQGE